MFTARIYSYLVALRRVRQYRTLIRTLALFPRCIETVFIYFVCLSLTCTLVQKPSIFKIQSFCLVSKHCNEWCRLSIAGTTM